MVYESRGTALGGSAEKAREYFQKALDFAAGKNLSVYLTYIDAFAIPDQDRKAFKKHLEIIKSFNVNKYPEFRLMNIISQRRARYLAKIEGDLFIGD